ncbi:putative cationic amino acid transporter [Hypsibius exemplaris]|uniref:Cationic amino acid transporter n=1 Tax=Hypsibius exemplaris TaxID=2072580 RepID=A0A1W0X427_HYPEX|nr:putative cationic amino acid transporter [Hypsibius exemplaris]
MARPTSFAHEQAGANNQPLQTGRLSSVKQILYPAVTGGTDRRDGQSSRVSQGSRVLLVRQREERSRINQCSCSPMQHRRVGSGSALGIYVYISAAAKDHSGPAIVLSVLGVGVVSWIVGSCYSELSCRVPQMGSCYLYSYTIFGELVAFLVGWNLILEAVITIALAAQSLSDHLDVLSDGQLAGWMRRDLGRLPWDQQSSPDIVAVGVIAVVAAAAICAKKKCSLTVQACLFVLHLLVVIAVIFLSLFHVNPSNWGTDSDFFRFGPQGVISGAALLMSSLSGVKSIAMTAEEVRKPSRNIPIAHTLSVMICSVTLFTLSAFLTLSAPADLFAEHAPVLRLFEDLKVRNSKYLLGVGAVCGLLLVIVNQIQYAERLIYSLARDKLLPVRLFARWNIRSNTPWCCRLMVACFAGVICLTVPFRCLLETISVGVLISFALTCMAVVMVRYDPCQIGLGKGNPLRKSISAESFVMSRVSSELSEATTNSEVSHSVSLTLKETAILLTAEKGTTMYSVDRFPAIEEECSSTSSGDGLPDLRTYRRVVNAVIWTGICSLVLGAVVRFGPATGEPLGWLALSTSFSLIFLNICCALYIYRAPTNQMMLVYSAGGVPFLPVAAMMCLCVMLFHLPAVAWIRWSAWSSLGLIMYFTYSRSRSTEGAPPAKEIFYSNEMAMQSI